MSAGQFDSDFQSTFERVREQVACPACYGELRLEGERVACTVCARVYPIMDGIPVLIADGRKAEPEGQS